MIAAIALALALAQDAPAAGPAEEPRSVFVDPLFLGAERPELRSVRIIHLVHDGARGVAARVERTQEEARALAAQIVRELAEGADFVELAKRWSANRNAALGAVLGSFPPGVLHPEFDLFLFAADVGDVSAPIETTTGLHVLQRVDTYAGCRQIMLAGDDARARCDELLARLRAGADFAELAREHSDDPESAARGGAVGVFERGSEDRLIKAAAFEAEVGEIVGPVPSPLGLHIVQRVPLDAIDPALAEGTWVRARSILVAARTALPGMPYSERTGEEAGDIAEGLVARIRAGEDMAALAREHDEDYTGRARAGDLGWIHRGTPKMSPVLDRLYLVEPGTLLDPIPIQSGWLILRRER